MYNLHQGGKYSAQIASHQAELSKEGKFTDQKYLSISSLQTDYLNLDRSSGCGKNSERENIVQKNFTFCGGANHSAEIFSRVSKRIREKIARMVILTTNIWNTRLTNVLDADLKII